MSIIFFTEILLVGSGTIACDCLNEIVNYVDASNIHVIEIVESSLSFLKKQCKNCPDFSACATDLGTVRINASAYYPSFYRNSKKVGTSDYLRVMRLMKIWAEGTFAVLKREHKLNKIQKRGLQKAIEECLLSATALNLKRLAKAV